MLCKFPAKRVLIAKWLKLLFSSALSWLYYAGSFQEIEGGSRALVQRKVGVGRQKERQGVNGGGLGRPRRAGITASLIKLILASNPPRRGRDQSRQSVYAASRSIWREKDGANSK
ncbi:unnamed protein product [Fusarium graminearum]|uniref:Uncharacterized protein n=1 Tax=Gibberella zeae TaxID=5518 RepID=A0A4E9EAL5_GIBZA|nr:unnamed protein product [Fusarium graminearum]CAF3630238.1 unnamed protein product [Fusarium graminearum]CAG1986209.1 unnamed protein product [Fusarium graminearum]CAG1992646.1 unnamed protein product [Fusarium graminearum]